MEKHSGMSPEECCTEPNRVVPEDEADLAEYHAAMDEYVRDGCKSRPIEELWEELGLN